MRRLLGLTAVLATAGAFAATPAAAAEGADAKQRVICKQQVRTGTRFPKKTCMSKGEWDAAAEQAKRQAAEEFSRPRISTERGN